MATSTAKCPHCGGDVAYDPTKAGGRARCGVCKGIFQLPVPGAAAMNDGNPAPPVHVATLAKKSSIWLIILAVFGGGCVLVVVLIVSYDLFFLVAAYDLREGRAEMQGTITSENVEYEMSADESEEAEQMRAEEVARKAAAIEKAKWRTWTTEDGQYTIRAKFIKLSGGKLKLEKEDGSSEDIDFKLLCKEDREFVTKRKWIKAGENVGQKPSERESSK